MIRWMFLIALLILSACSRNDTSMEQSDADSATLLLNRDTVDVLLQNELRFHAELRLFLHWLDSLYDTDAPAGKGASWEDIAYQMRHVLHGERRPLSLENILIDSAMAVLEFRFAGASGLPGDRFWLQLASVGGSPVFINVLYEPEPADMVYLLSTAWDMLLLAGFSGSAYSRADIDGVPLILLDTTRYKSVEEYLHTLHPFFPATVVDSIGKDLRPKRQCGALPCVRALSGLRPLNWTESQIEIVRRPGRVLALRVSVAGVGAAEPAFLEAILEMTLQGWKLGAVPAELSADGMRT
jgi:hypothetical protein